MLTLTLGPVYSPKKGKEGAVDTIMVIQKFLKPEALRFQVDHYHCKPELNSALVKRGRGFSVVAAVPLKLVPGKKKKSVPEDGTVDR